MTVLELGILVAVVLAIIAFATWVGALQIALRDPSRSEIEDRLKSTQENKTGRMATVEWLFSRRIRLLSEVAIVRAVSTVAVVFVLLGVDGDVWQVAIATTVAILTLWFATSVLADPLASHLGPSLIGGMVALRASTRSCGRSGGSSAGRRGGAGSARISRRRRPRIGSDVRSRTPRWTADSTSPRRRCWRTWSSSRAPRSARS